MLKIYENIKERRLDLGLTQTQLADKLGYADKSMIAKVEKGQIDLSHSKILAFADALKISPGELMGWDDDPSSSSPAPAADLSEDEQQLVVTYRELNEIGKREARKRVEELTEIERYIKIRTDQSAEA